MRVTRENATILLVMLCIIYFVRMLKLLMLLHFEQILVHSNWFCVGLISRILDVSDKYLDIKIQRD